MLQDIDAGSTTPGTPFRATLTQDILRNGRVVVPVGSELHGRVVYASAGNRLSGGSVIHLRPDEFVLPDGTRYHLHAQVIDTFGSDTKPKGEGDIVANQHGKRTMAELGLGAGSGAVRWSRHRWRSRCGGRHSHWHRRGHRALVIDQLVGRSSGFIDRGLQPYRSHVPEPRCKTRRRNCYPRNSEGRAAALLMTRTEGWVCNNPTQAKRRLEWATQTIC